MNFTKIAFRVGVTILVDFTIKKCNSTIDIKYQDKQLLDNNIQNIQNNFKYIYKISLDEQIVACKHNLSLNKITSNGDIKNLSYMPKIEDCIEAFKVNNILQKNTDKLSILNRQINFFKALNMALTGGFIYVYNNY